MSSQSDTPIPCEEPELKQFSGHFLLFRKTHGDGISRKAGGHKMPYFRHRTFEQAEDEARRLHRLFPLSTFVIMQEVARLKIITNGE